MSDVGSFVNEKVYIHEYVDIIGHNRGRYMYHMTANWSPTAQEERHQLCYGVWGVVGSTGRWPQVARSFGHELGHRDLQDPKLAAWWAAAAELRAGGADRLLVPAPWMPTIEQACAAGIRGDVYAHEQIAVPRGSSARYLEFVRREAVPVMSEFGWKLAGAWETALVDDSECFLLWAVPTWQEWAERESARRHHRGLVELEAQILASTERLNRILLVEAALSPMRLGRQPSRTDRTEAWEG
jgi:hypothetical protein